MNSSPLYDFFEEIKLAANSKYGSLDHFEKTFYNTLKDDIPDLSAHIFILKQSDVSTENFDDFLSHLQFLFLNSIGNVMAWEHNGDKDLAINMTNYCFEMFESTSDKMKITFNDYAYALSEFSKFGTKDLEKLGFTVSILGYYAFMEKMYSKAPEPFRIFFDSIKSLELPFRIQDMISILSQKVELKRVNKFVIYIEGSNVPISMHMNEQLEEAFYSKIDKIQKLLIFLQDFTGWDEKRAKEAILKVLKKLLPSIKKYTGLRQLLLAETYKFLVSKNIKPIEAGFVLYDLAQLFMNEFDSYEDFSNKDKNYNPKFWEWNQFRHREILRVSGINRKFS